MNDNSSLPAIIETNTPPAALSIRPNAYLRIAHGAVSVAVLILLACVSKHLFDEYGAKLSAEYSVEWSGISPLALLPGPVLFTHDVSTRTLRHRGPVDEKTKLELIAMFPPEGKGKQIGPSSLNDSYSACNKLGKKPLSCVDAEISYRSAVEMLTYQSNKNRFPLLVSLLMVAAAFGAIGSHVRSMTAFVNHMGTEKLDLRKWWPYYFIRPFYGAIFGVVVVTLIKAGFLTASNGANDPTLWWISLSFFAGFGDREFAEKLRQIIKALFGESG